MIIAKPHKPLLLINAGDSVFLALEFMRAVQFASKMRIQKQVDDRYHLFYGAVFNLMSEYFVSGFATEKLRNRFDLSFSHTDTSFRFSIRPLVKSGTEHEVNITECHAIVDSFLKDLKEIADDRFLEECHVPIDKEYDHYDGHKTYHAQFDDTKELLKFARTLYKRMSGIAYDEADRYTFTVLESIERSPSRCPKLTRIPSIEYIEALLNRAQGRDATNETDDFYAPNYTN